MRSAIVLTVAVCSLACSKTEGTKEPSPPIPTPSATEKPSASSSASASAAPSGSGSTTAKQKCPADDLASCGIDGCADPGSPHALFNRYKRRTTTAQVGGSPPPNPATDGAAIAFDSATPVTHAILTQLQAQATQLVGQKKELSANERAKIASLNVGNMKLGEGVGVRLAGFLAPHKGNNASGVHPGGVESVNCKLDKDEWKDIHIPILAQANDDECHGAIAEMIPQGRDAHPNWTTTALRKLGKDKKVLFVGPLFYDNEHGVHDDCSITDSQPKRMSLWEVHPVTELWVCETGQCDASSKAGWKKMD